MTIKQKPDAELRPGVVRECQFPEQSDRGISHSSLSEATMQNGLVGSFLLRHV
jgi:hypothetical protein